MNGRRLLDYGTRVIGGIADSDTRYFFDCLDQAAIDFIHDTLDLITTTEITTVADQQVYMLPPDFLQLHVKDKDRRLVVKYYDGTNYYLPKVSSFEYLWSENATDAKAYPSEIAIYQRAAVDDYVSGSATADGAASGRLSTLTDAAADFVTDGIKPRDEVHNHDDGSDGIVVAVTDATHLQVALFNGTADAWTNGDSYTITKQPNPVVMLDAPSESAGHILTVPYIRKPSPVYHDVGQWEIPSQCCRGIASRAAYLYKTDYDFDPDVDQHLQVHYDRAVLNRKTQIAAGILQSKRYPKRS